MRKSPQEEAEKALSLRRRLKARAPQSTGQVPGQVPAERSGTDVSPAAGLVGRIGRLEQLAEREAPAQAGVGAAAGQGLRRARGGLLEVPGIAVVDQGQAVGEPAAHGIAAPDGCRSALPA